MAKGKMSEPGRFAYDGLQNLFHEKARLGIMTSLLASSDGLVFRELKLLCALSDGNLSRHLQVLEEARFVQIEKTGAGRAAKTHVNATARGRKAFEQYLKQLEQVLSEASSVCKSTGVNFAG